MGFETQSPASSVNGADEARRRLASQIKGGATLAHRKQAFASVR
jgi:hypothetical protein